MRIVNRTEFLEMPPGTLYYKHQSYDNDLCIKNDTWTSDWIYTELTEWDSNDSGQQWDREVEMENDSSVSYPVGLATARDGLFDETETFVVYDNNDVQALIAALKS